MTDTGAVSIPDRSSERTAARAPRRRQELADIAAGTFTTHDPREQVCHDLARILVAGGQVDDHMFSKAVAHLGALDLYELTVLAGYYTTLAWTLRVFDVGIPSGDVPR